jgi:hypothetical protein
MKGFIARLTMGGLVMASGLSAASAVQARCVTDRFSFGYGVARASARWLIAKDADRRRHDLGALVDRASGSAWRGGRGLPLSVRL